MFSRLPFQSRPLGDAGGRGTLGWLLVIAVLVGLLPARPAPAQNSRREYAIKAGLVYNFLKFVDWPAQALSGNTLVMGVYGSNPFGPSLSSLNGKTVKGRTIAVRVVNSPAEAEDCHVLFIPAEQAGRRSQILEAVRGSSVLTIGESRGFAREGGMINFVVKDDRVGFEVNLEAAERARLSISSQMLKYATIVRS